MADKDSSSYPVGYAKSPQATRFQPGRSGNPKGRHKAAKNFVTLFEEELEAKIPVTENGKRKKITKRQAAVKQIVNKAVTGDVKAFSTIRDESRLRDGQPGNESGQDVLSSAQDEQVIAGILDRLRRKLSEAPGESTDASRPSTDDEEA